MLIIILIFCGALWDCDLGKICCEIRICCLWKSQIYSFILCCWRCWWNGWQSDCIFQHYECDQWITWNHAAIYTNASHGTQKHRIFLRVQWLYWLRTYCSLVLTSLCWRLKKLSVDYIHFLSVIPTIILVLLKYMLWRWNGVSEWNLNVKKSFPVTVIAISISWAYIWYMICGPRVWNLHERQLGQSIQSSLFFKWLLLVLQVCSQSQNMLPASTVTVVSSSGELNMLEDSLSADPMLAGATAQVNFCWQFFFASQHINIMYAV